MALEQVEQQKLALWLDHQQLLWLHVPNEGLKSINYNMKMKAQGLKSGAPDVFIFTPPPNMPHKRGVAIELKRSTGGTLSKEQKRWLEDLDALGWEARCLHGAQSAIFFLQNLGYGQRPIIEVRDYGKKDKPQGPVINS
jgi:hypothetical protein